MKNNGKIRIQKVLSENGIMSRRRAEDAILRGKIKVNGHPATVGMKIDPEKDIIHIGKEKVVLQKNQKHLYIMMNKPRGYVTTTKDELGRKCVMDLLTDLKTRVYPVGRLDKNTEGLLLFTSDGEFANYMMHPSHNVTKTYRVTVRPNITDEQLATLAGGVEIDSGKTIPALVRVLTKEADRVVLQITIREGKNRQIRKMCEAVGLEVARLKRTSVGSLRLGMIKPGRYRDLTLEELKLLRANLKNSQD